MESTKIQEFDLDPNCGFAKEETAQAILGAVGNGVEPSFRSPVSIKGGFVNTTAQTGTGRGKLYVSQAKNTEAKATIVIDGVTVLNNENLVTATTDGDVRRAEIEFTKSFSIKNWASATSLNWIQYTAVFY